VDIWLEWLLLLQLFMAGRSALLSKADVVNEVAVLGSVATTQQPTTRGCTLSKALRGGLLGQGGLAGEEHPSRDRVALVHWMTQLVRQAERDSVLPTT